MNPILIPCDFSQPAREAFKVGAEIAMRTYSEIIALHVIDNLAVYDDQDGRTAIYSPELTSLLESDANRHFNLMIDPLPANHPKVHIRVKVGNILSTILKIVKIRSVGLVVMGKTGRSGIEHLFVGSTTEKMVRYCPVPVLSVITADFVKTVKNILLPTTFALDQTKFIAKVKELQKLFGACLHILYVDTHGNHAHNEKVKALMNDYAKTYELTNFETHIIHAQSEATGITTFANDRNMDIIAIGTHARIGLAHLLHGSISEGLANHFRGAVWTYTLEPS